MPLLPRMCHLGTFWLLRTCPCPVTEADTAYFLKEKKRSGKTRTSVARWICEGGTEPLIQSGLMADDLGWSQQRVRDPSSAATSVHPSRHVMLLR